MIPTLLDKQTLQLINRRTLRYTPVAAEKDYFLALALKVLSESPLFETLVFKGGTALHHSYLPQSRFSEDLDFTALDKTLTGEAVAGLFASVPILRGEETLHLECHDQDRAIEVFRRTAICPTRSSLRWTRLQDVMLPARQLPYANVWGMDVTVNVMDIRASYAEKIRAMS